MKCTYIRWKIVVPSGYNTLAWLALLVVVPVRLVSMFVLI